MKNVILLLVISLFFYGCSCGDPTVISFTEKDKEWLIYQKGKTFTYTNQKNDTLVYVTEKVEDFPMLQDNRSHGGFYPSFNANCVIAKWDGVRVRLRNIVYPKKDSMEIWLQKSVISTSSGYKKGDGLSPRIYWHSNKYSRDIPYTKIIDSLSFTTFDTLNLEKLPYPYNSSGLLLKKMMLRKGKIYENVLLLEYLWFDSIKNTITATTKIYYHKTTGIIRFENDNNGDIWELEN
jgi:hypothetical protein